MQSVAHHLQIEAMAQPDEQKDVFARSAYNRYYYAVFLSARSMVSELDPKWLRLPHADYPKVLLGKNISTRLKVEALRANKNGDFELQKRLDDAVRACAALASLITKANAARKVADYEPDKLVEFTTSGRFSLNSITVTDAHNWLAAVDNYTNVIKDGWKQIA